MSPIPVYGVHPLAELMPLMGDDEYLNLVSSIQRRGFDALIPIVLHEGKILDGRHRYRACGQLGIVPTFANLPTSEDAYEFVLKHNLDRRHLTTAQRAMIVANVGKLEKKGEKKASMASMRARLHVSDGTVRKAQRIQRNGSEKLNQLVNKGQLRIDVADQLAKLPTEEQDAHIACGQKVIKRKATDIRKRGQEAIDDVKAADAISDPKPTKYSADLQEILDLFGQLSRKASIYLQSPLGKQLEKDIGDLQLGWYDHSRSKVVDSGDGPRVIPPQFVGLRPMRRLFASAERRRHISKDKLKAMLEDLDITILDADTPPEFPDVVLPPVNADGTAPEGYAVARGLD